MVGTVVGKPSGASRTASPCTNPVSTSTLTMPTTNRSTITGAMTAGHHARLGRRSVESSLYTALAPPRCHPQRGPHITCFGSCSFRPFQVSRPIGVEDRPC